MLRLIDLAAVGGRNVRQDDLGTLGVPTSEKIIEAIDKGNLDEAKALARYSVDEARALHALFCDWIWDLLTRVSDSLGEEAMLEMLRGSQSGWMMYRTWKGYLRMSVQERVFVTAEIIRSHYCGSEQNGQIEVVETDEYYAIVMDPCGSGGRMRRGDPVEKTPSRLDKPYCFGATKKAYPESWGKKNVPYYCLHCAMNEILPMTWGKYPLWVTAYDEDAQKPCEWRFYKHASDIPSEYFERVGMTKPSPGEGQY